MRSFEDSLQRLGLPRIDLLLIHDLDISHHATDAGVTARRGTPPREFASMSRSQQGLV